MLSSSTSDADDPFCNDSELLKDTTPDLENIFKADNKHIESQSDSDSYSDSDDDDNNVESRGIKRKREVKNQGNTVVRSRRKQSHPRRQNLAKRPFQRIIRPILQDQAEQKGIDHIRIQKSAVDILWKVSTQRAIEFNSEVWRAAALNNRKEPNESDINAAKYVLQRTNQTICAPSQQHAYIRYGSLPAKNRGFIAAGSTKVYKKLNEVGVLDSAEVKDVIKKEKSKIMRIKRKKLHLIFCILL
jgi:histone H3/H4